MKIVDVWSKVGEARVKLVEAAVDLEVTTRGDGERARFIPVTDLLKRQHQSSNLATSGIV